jgi:cytochrome d ubiquinol oxidase subunit I
VVIASLWLRWQQRLFTTRWFLRTLVILTPSGIVATLAGWYLAETGRQPWVIYGILRTADAVSPVPARAMVATLVAFVCTYALFITAFCVFFLRMIRRGPELAPDHAEASGSVKNALRQQVMGKRVGPHPVRGE